MLCIHAATVPIAIYRTGMYPIVGCSYNLLRFPLSREPSFVAS